MNCLFCQIAKRELDSDIVYEDDHVVAFSDIQPQAPIHKLIIPRQHIETLNDLNIEHNEIIAHMILTATKLAEDLKIDQDGYRVIFNCNRNGGQAVYHIHLHLLGGRQMTWPPG